MCVTKILSRPRSVAEQGPYNGRSVFPGVAQRRSRSTLTEMKGKAMEGHNPSTTASDSAMDREHELINREGHLTEFNELLIDVVKEWLMVGVRFTRYKLSAGLVLLARTICAVVKYTRQPPARNVC